MNALSRKIFSLPISQFAQFQRVCPEKLRVPDKASCFDIVRILSKEGESTDIFTFRGKSKGNNVGDIIRRFFIKSNNEGRTVVERNYIPFKKTKILDPMDEEEMRMLNVFGRKISSVTKKNGKYVEKMEEIQTRTETPDGKPIVHISKIITKPNAHKETEWQSLYKYEKGVEPKGYSIINGTKSNKSEFEFRNMPEDFKSDIYFPYHLYSFKRFKKSIPNIAENPNHKAPKVDVIWYKDNFADMEGFYDGSVHLNERALSNRYSVVKSAAHEKEHAYQDNQVQRMLKHKKVDNVNETKQYKKDFENYVDSSEDFFAYRNQLIEQNARRAGSAAENSYRESSFNLKEEFPYAPDYLIGPSLKDENLCAKNNAPKRFSRNF